MQKLQAQKMVARVLEQPFDKGQFRVLVKNLLNEMDEVKAFRQPQAGQFISEGYQDSVSSLDRIGQYTDPSGKVMDILIVRLKKDTTLDRGRTTQRNYIAKYLKEDRGGQLKDGALVAFVAPNHEDWRFSFVKMEYRFDEKGKVREEFTPARRYSFLVGKNESSHTAQQCLVSLLEKDDKNPTLEDLEEAFSVEKVTKEFFAEYHKLFWNVKEALDKVIERDLKVKKDFEKNEVSPVEFSKKLLGQIVFLYFLQKKGWFGVDRGAEWGTGPRDFLRKLFNRHQAGHFHTTRQLHKDSSSYEGCHSREGHKVGNLQGLAQSPEQRTVRHPLSPPTRRSFPRKRESLQGLAQNPEQRTERHPLSSPDTGATRRFFNDVLEPLFYEALQKERDDDYYKLFDCRIPFLNGGLFEPIGGYDWVNTDILLPDSLFSSAEGVGNEGIPLVGIFDIFDRYNFTVNEDEPLEKEVAVDPEMLGKVFENLLEVRDRKSKGTYYTPREIVHYMCQQSLINYLHSTLSKQSVNTAQSSGSASTVIPTNLDTSSQSENSVPPFVPADPAVQKADLEQLIKISDSAIEHDKVHTQKKAEQGQVVKGKYSQPKQPQSIIDNAILIDQALANIRVCDPAVGSGAFLVGMMSEVVRVRQALTSHIKNCPKMEERTDYHFKRHCIEHCLYGVDVDPGAVDIAKLRLWLSLVVDEEDREKLKPLPNLDYKLRCGNSLLGIKKDDGGGTIDRFFEHNLEGLHKKKNLYFNETSTNKKKQYKQEIELFIDKVYAPFMKEAEGVLEKQKRFDFEIYFSEVFQEKSGFDIVIANPPYIDSEEMVRKQERIRKIIANHYKMTKGNWPIYIAFFEKSFNILNKIGSLAFITPDKWLAKPFGYEFRKQSLYKIYTVLNAGRKIFFDAKVDAIVSLFSNNYHEKLKVFKFLKKEIIFKSEIDKKIITEPLTFDFIFSDHLQILLKIDNFFKSQKQKIEDSTKTINCQNACATSDAYKLQPLIQDIARIENFESKKYFQIINTGTIGKYNSKWGKVKMKYLGKKYLCPVINKSTFLNTFKGAYSQKSIQKKIIIKGLTLLDSCLDLKGDVIPGKSTLIVIDEDTKNLKFLSGLLNSKVAFFYMKEKHPASSYNQGINFTKEMINNFPIPKVSQTVKKEIILFVDKILSITKAGDYLQNPAKQTQVREYEKQIDQLVYKLYDLTPEEIKVVEKS